MENHKLLSKMFENKNKLETGKLICEVLVKNHIRLKLQNFAI
ncbi:hypothetical protein SAMN06265348_12424 [Pedobacter westerhofensis]|uniref:Uncharacterized protein n=1 Tax=Pedobacter westerhofensis TaxID=425512 RepID=A0A521FTZ3_9SPHI|nr:hypothetical protein SAMN06265348_12424 [Pedobacter westerhofensis]